MNKDDDEVGRKDDHDKPRWGLLPLRPVTELVKVLTYGSRKYADDNWKHVPNGPERYYDALQRHIAAYRLGESHDPETNIHHLAHAGCNLLFLLWFELKKDDNET